MITNLGNSRGSELECDKKVCKNHQAELPTILGANALNMRSTYLTPNPFVAVGYLGVNPGLSRCRRSKKEERAGMAEKACHLRESDN